jgi:hypothetical protein
VHALVLIDPPLIQRSSAGERGRGLSTSSSRAGGVLCLGLEQGQTAGEGCSNGGRVRGAVGVCFRACLESETDAGHAGQRLAEGGCRRRKGAVRVRAVGKRVAGSRQRGRGRGRGRGRERRSAATGVNIGWRASRHAGVSASLMGGGKWVGSGWWRTGDAIAGFGLAGVSSATPLRGAPSAVSREARWAWQEWYDDAVLAGRHPPPTTVPQQVLAGLSSIDPTPTAQGQPEGRTGQDGRGEERRGQVRTGQDRSGQRANALMHSAGCRGWLSG